MTDDENSKVFASKLLPETIAYGNGYKRSNDPPVTSFSVDRTSVEVGDSVNFASTSRSGRTNHRIYVGFERRRV